MIYYEFMWRALILLTVLYGVGMWKSYCTEKQREKTLREAMN